MKFAVLATAVIMVALGSGGASALTLSRQNPSDVFGSNGDIDVVLNFNHTLEAADAGGVALSNGVNSFVAWCLDGTHPLTLPFSYSVTTTPFSTTTGTIDPTRLADIEKLFEVNYSTLNLSSNDQSAGFQLALWEILYESDTKDPFSLSTGGFQAISTHLTRGAIADANAFLASLTKPIVQLYQFTFYESNQQNGKYSQNLVSVMPVPLPAAGLLLGTGVLGLFAIKRRRAARKLPG